MGHLSVLRGMVSKTLGRGGRMSLAWRIAVGGVFGAWIEWVSESVEEVQRPLPLSKVWALWSARQSHDEGLATSRDSKLTTDRSSCSRVSNDSTSESKS